LERLELARSVAEAAADAAREAERLERYRKKALEQTASEPL
jgi:hypothetical protein